MAYVGNGRILPITMKGDKGDTGAKIVSTELVGTEANGDKRYRQTFDDGSTSEFISPKGDRGDDYIITDADKQEIADLLQDQISQEITEIETAIDEIILLQEGILKPPVALFVSLMRPNESDNMFAYTGSGTFGTCTNGLFTTVHDDDFGIDVVECGGYYVSHDAGSDGDGGYCDIASLVKPTDTVDENTVYYLMDKSEIRTEA